MMQGMVINMEEAKLQTLAQIKGFLDGTANVIKQLLVGKVVQKEKKRCRNTRSKVGTVCTELVAVAQSIAAPKNKVMVCTNLLL
jgi:hypothetical protein